MKRATNTRQRIRQGLLLTSLLLFPITINYLSPYVIMDGASQGIVNGSAIVFSFLFLSSLFLGRAWCAWVCPAGGLGEACSKVNDRPIQSKWADRVKWIIWFPWLALIIFLVVKAGGYHQINPLLDTVNGISVAGDADRPALYAYIIYYGVIVLFAGSAVIFGRRAGCHTLCWMAPFMILGRKLRNLAGWPALRLQAQPDQCTSCKTCTTHCPMSLPVDQMVKSNQMEHSECILCGSCIDGCPKKVITYTFQSGKA